MTAMRPAIEVQGVTKSYGANRGIAEVTFNVQPGEILGFLGPNGAGKSTTLRCILGFLHFRTGSIHVAGHDVQSDSVSARRAIGNLPSEFTLEDRMTGSDLIAFFARIRNSPASIAQASVLADRFGADLNRPMRQLSRGNKQKIGIIQAICHRPPVIILDEPTSGLDPLVQDIFLDVLREARDTGQAILFSSHNLAEVEQIADRIGMIRDGQLIAVQRPDEIAGRSARLIRMGFASPVSPAQRDAVTAIPGCADVVVDGNTLACTMHSDIRPLLLFAGDQNLTSFDAERPSLEELFRRFYTGDAA
ncbi:MAG TPA: ABC transporter ATP-binding protein [Thermomicrobiales bacterium]|nr:ABC transporter ATP-binding protein [Thermomicrobiales bacterium]